MIDRKLLLSLAAACCATLVVVTCAHAIPPSGSPTANQQGGSQSPNGSQVMQQMLARFDTNGDGQLSADEVKPQSANGDTSFARSILEKHDSNGDGVLNLSEQATAATAIQRMINNRTFPSGWMTGGNGKVASATKKKKPKETAKTKTKENLDTNGDGKISKEERDAAKAKENAKKAEGKTAKQ